MSYFEFIVILFDQQSFLWKSIMIIKISLNQIKFGKTFFIEIIIEKVSVSKNYLGGGVLRPKYIS